MKYFVLKIESLCESVPKHVIYYCSLSSQFQAILGAFCFHNFGLLVNTILEPFDFCIPRATHPPPREQNMSDAGTSAVRAWGGPINI
jgi:hypothetical protein